MVVWILSMGKIRENDCGDDPNSLKPCLKHFHASAILQVCNQSKLYWKGVERKHCIGHGLLYIKAMHRCKDNPLSEYWVKKWVGNIESQEEIIVPKTYINQSVFQEIWPEILTLTKDLDKRKVRRVHLQLL